MTIVAYKDGIMCADRRHSSDGLIRPPRSKLLTIDDVGAIGGCGAMASRETEKRALHAVAGGASVVADYHEFAMVLTATGTLHTIQNGEVIHHDNSTPHAIGSGYMIAMGAMYAGATAWEAVQICARLHNGCGDGCDDYSPAHDAPADDTPCPACSQPMYLIHDPDCTFRPHIFGETGCKVCGLYSGHHTEGCPECP